MADTFSKSKPSQPNLFFLSLLALWVTTLVHLIVGWTQVVSTTSSKIEPDEFHMKLDPDSVVVTQVQTIPEIKIVSRQTIFFKDEQGMFIPDEDCRPLIVNTCGQVLHDVRVVWHISCGRYSDLPEGAANFMELCHALEDLEIFDSTKAYNKGNWTDVSPSTLVPGNSARITLLSNGVQKQIDESGFARGQLYVTANASNGLTLRMVYGFEFEPITTSREGMLCRIAELSDIDKNQTDPTP